MNKCKQCIWSTVMSDNLVFCPFPKCAEEAIKIPYKSKRPCSYPGCPALVNGRYCDEHQKIIDKQYNKYARDPSTKLRYDSSWKHIRNIYIKAHPLCEQCKKDGKLTPAQEVHHILPLSKGGTHDKENLMSLCTICHSRITSLEGGRWG